MNNFIIFFIFVPVLAIVLLTLNLILAPHKPNEFKLSIYECGFLALPGQTRIPISIHFTTTAMIFLLFDIELILLFPLANSMSQVSTFGMSIALIFLTVLTIGFIIEIGSGAIGLSNIYNKPLYKLEAERK